MAKPILNWDKDSDKEVVYEAKKIIECLTGNPLFTVLQPEIPTLTILTNEFSESITKSIKGSVLDTDEKNDKRKLLEAFMLSVGLKVSDICKGDGTMIDKSGYRLQAEPKPAGELPAPDNVKIVAKKKRSLYVKWKAVANAHSYLVKFAECPITKDTIWKTEATTKSSIDIENMDSGKEYGVEVVAIGSNPKRNWSDTVYSYVL